MTYLTLEERLALLRRRRRPGIARMAAQALGWAASGLLLLLMAVLITTGQ
jgi:hypothetical protein